MKDLNAKETQVLDALVKASDYQGHDFGFTDDAWQTDLLEGISKAQFSGYVSQLQAKGYIFCLTDDPDWENGFYLTLKGAAYAGAEYYAENHPDRK